jgi:hypothetical protein
MKISAFVLSGRASLAWRLSPAKWPGFTASEMGVEKLLSGPHNGRPDFVLGQ